MNPTASKAHRTQPAAQTATRIWDWLTEPGDSLTDSHLRRQSRLLAATLILLLASCALILILSSILPREMNLLPPVTRWVSLGLLAALIVAYRMNYAGQFDLAARLSVGVLVAGILVSAYLDFEAGHSLLHYLAIPIIMSSVFLPKSFTVMLSTLLIAHMVLILPWIPAAFIGSVPVLFTAFIAGLSLAYVHYRDRLEIDRQAALSESEERFRQIFMEAPTAIAMVDSEFRFVRVNRRICQMFGYSEQEMQHLTFTDVTDPEERHQYRDVMFETDQRHHRSERRCLTKQGQVLWVNLTGTVIREKNIRYGLLMIEDISERKKKEQESRRAEVLRVELAKQREMSQFKGRFISAVTHELRSPLTSIITSTELLERYRDRLSPADQREHFSRIQAEVSRLTRMTEELLEISRGEAGQITFNPKPVNLPAFCRALIKEMKSTDSLKHPLTLSIEEGIDVVPLDLKLLRYILTNLIANAIKYTPDGGEINVSVAKSYGQAVIRVQDQGIGIPKEDLKHLFEPFFRGSNVGAIHGTGLGLKIVKDYVELHGGSITCDSIEGQGSTFTLSLPLNQPRTVN